MCTKEACIAETHCGGLVEPDTVGMYSVQRMKCNTQSTQLPMISVSSVCAGDIKVICCGAQ